MKSWWSEKNGREQRSLIFLAIFCLLAGFWYGVVQPLDNAIAQQRQENDRLRSE
ncbi:MAG: type II secretion system protein GspM, partial [Leclercia sp.]